MTVHVRPLTAPSGLRFELSLENWATVILSIPAEEIDQSAYIADNIRKRVLDYLNEFGYDSSNVHITFC